MAIKLSLKGSCLWSSIDDIKRLIAAEAVNDNDVARPLKPLERPPDVRRFVVSQNDWRYLIKHVGESPIAFRFRVVKCQLRSDNHPRSSAIGNQAIANSSSTIIRTTSRIRYWASHPSCWAALDGFPRPIVISAGLNNPGSMTVWSRHSKPADAKAASANSSRLCDSPVAIT